MDAPERIYSVMSGHLSIARHYGGCRFNGHEYVYNPRDDSLIRADVLKREQAAKRQPRKKAKPQPSLFATPGAGGA